MSEKLLDVKNLKTEFHTDKGSLVAVNDVSFYVKKEEIVGLVGESGSGKSVTSLSVLGLLPENGNVAAGEILLENKDLLKMNKHEIKNIRGRDVAMIFQDPMSSLNPVLKIGEQLMECTKLHLKYDNSRAREHAIDMIKRVGIPVPEDVMNRYPHQLSGGMSQRIMIAMAMSCNPKLLIADEPTTALDVTIQAQVMELMVELKEKNKIGVLLITHDLGVVAEMCDRVMVMYCGRIVEMADVVTLFSNPLHPYTKGLIASVPRIGRNVDELPYIAGRVPDLSQMPKGCKFAPRCSQAMEICHREEPKLTAVGDNRQCRCHLIQGRSETNE